MAARSSSSEQSLQVPFGGMALRPAMALLTRPSRPPLASARTFHAAVSWFFGASSRPVPWHALQNLATTSAPLRAAPPAAAATAPTPLPSLDADFANQLQAPGDSFVGRSLSAHRPQGQYGSVGHQNLLSPVHLTPSSWLETLAATVRERCGIINGNIPMDSMTICSTLPVAGES